ncbi:protein serine/threonine phosphatase with extracellular sensor [Solidesulfovibrio carbinoliphilus subsp. oakridgensis]|uniref:Protein serine/threonine phosphatase with extracellular sensor n=1 Tax=Solidesulfovibrio carbinoliphilus subsp. oakridgensis TaxID=694327 RepID=G7Q549_9BACT|nr:SpoIIE family protein phosphatase [Solidesulfovibrio carbinoliphilus]EHJ48372.1 protein serine/threonine phosphatase with extracellular sensor [Solidesulfovibrio carbinoliphilus subsp. oakridgensis]
MRLRWKFFLILLGFSLVPLVVVTSFTRGHVVRLGRTIAGEGRAMMTDIVKNELRQTAEDYALILRRSKSAMDFSLTVLATEAARALAGPAPANTAVYRASDGDRDRKAPPDMEVAQDYTRRRADGGAEPLPVSRDNPVVYRPPGARATGSADARLAALGPAFALLRSELGDLLLFAGVTLADGSHVSFPGHVGYPADYDPRDRPWYQAARAAFVPQAPVGGGVVWNHPAVDAATGQVTLTLSKAFAGPDGRFAGVASLDVPLARFLQQQEIASQWSEAMRTFVVAPPAADQAGRPELTVWAERTPEGQAPDWKSTVNFERLTSADAAGLAALIATMQREKAGVAELPFGGQEAFWAYSSLMGGASFLCIVPKSMLAPLAEQAGQEILSATGGIVRLTGLAVAAVLVAVTVAAFLSTRAFVRPLLHMVEAWKRLGGGDFSVRLTMRVGDERQTLIDAFNETVPVLADHLRLQRSMEVAQEVQRNLLPAAPPEIPGLDVAGVGLSCDETGGDYFDYRAVVRDGEVCLDTVVGDVTGHGLPSALLMATGRALLLATEDSETPAERVSRANRLLARDVGDSGRFMTLVAMEIRPLAGQARYVRAGHDPALLYDPEADAFTAWTGRGLPLGIQPDYRYEENVRPFARPGLVLVLGTDGIWETRNPGGEMYGKERFRESIRRAARESAAAIVATVLRDLAAFRAGGRQKDDVTLVVVKKV